jgi:hypothetical protein
MLDAGSNVNTLVFQVSEVHELRDGVPSPVWLDVLADLSVPGCGPFEEVQDPWVKGADGLVEFAVFIRLGIVMCVDFSNVGAFIGLILLWVDGDWPVIELFDPIGRLQISVLDGDDEVRGSLLIVKYVPFRGDACGLMGQILGGFKVATYFILIFYLTGFYYEIIISNLLNRNIWQI